PESQRLEALRRRLSPRRLRALALDASDIHVHRSLERIRRTGGRNRDAAIRLHRTHDRAVRDVPIRAALDFWTSGMIAASGGTFHRSKCTSSMTRNGIMPNRSG